MCFLRRSNKTDIYQIINTPKYRFLRILNIQLQPGCHVLLLTSTVFRSERNNSDSILSVLSDQIISDPAWRCMTEWRTLIGRDPRDTVFSLVELDYADAKVYAITTNLRHFVPFGVLLWHDKWLSCTERINYRRPYVIKNQRKERNTYVCIPMGGAGPLYRYNKIETYINSSS